jgi:hypothetical protein
METNTNRNDPMKFRYHFDTNHYQIVDWVIVTDYYTDTPKTENITTVLNSSLSLSLKLRANSNGGTQTRCIDIYEIIGIYYGHFDKPYENKAYIRLETYPPNDRYNHLYACTKLQYCLIVRDVSEKRLLARYRIVK